ncbi:MAG TPA: two-component regulator propeller domain-containing protein, partial [Bacteroidales bacterium]|nr:two-component regulator propeller domain-containing protein [Bacteroidales bacterium]
MKKNNLHTIILSCVFLFLYSGIYGNDSLKIKRFELFNTRDGLSQNSVLCDYADHLGYLWFGTMNGLNRYDGYNFKIYKAYPGKAEALSNNRISAIWEDAKNILWVKTYDGYYHYLDRETDKFTTFPNYLRSQEEKNSSIVSFSQTSPDDIWLCSSNSGVYHLSFDSTTNKYHSSRYFSRGTGAITNNKTSFAVKDTNGDLWIGTENGLNQLYSKEISSLHPDFQHLFIDTRFTSATKAGDTLWFGTANKGLLIYDTQSRTFKMFDKESGMLPDNEITLVKYSAYNRKVIVGTGKGGLLLYDRPKKKFIRYSFGGLRITKVNEDHTGNLWVNTEKFGVTRITPKKNIKKYYQLTPEEIQPLVDDERQYFFEDTRGNLWIGLHGSGLALYNQNSDSFTFFRNNPTDPSTISSNFVHCITEDKSGILWVGTGQFNGGVNKIVTSNNSFQQLSPHKEYDNMAENVIRSLLYDREQRLWVATKSGELFIYNADLKPLSHYSYIPLINKKLPGHNIYCMMQDKAGYLWLGSKGGGILVSTRPLNKISGDCSDLRFYNYRNEPDDTTSLSNNMVYSIINDREGNIWIG